jgi:hypothetical protein
MCYGIWTKAPKSRSWLCLDSNHVRSTTDLCWLFHPAVQEWQRTCLHWLPPPPFRPLWEPRALTVLTHNAADCLPTSPTHPLHHLLPPQRHVNDITSCRALPPHIRIIRILDLRPSQRWLEEYYLLGSPPSSGSKSKPSNKPAKIRHSSETSIDLTTQRYITVNGDLGIHI